jgi:hypothetical protein
MTQRSMGKLAAVSLTIAIAAVPPAFGVGPGEAGGGHRPARTSGPFLAGTDYVVLIWYRGDNALETFQYQAYDIRKGEYTPAVDEWLELMRTKHPRHIVLVREVDVDRVRGETEKLKVGSVIHRELLIAAAQSGVVLGAPLRIGPGPSATQRPTPRAGTLTEMPGAGGASIINPVQGTSPFPVPYPRPHP